MADVTFSWSPPRVTRNPFQDRDPGRPVQNNPDVQVHAPPQAGPFVPRPRSDDSAPAPAAGAPVSNSDVVQFSGVSHGSRSDVVIMHRHPDALPPEHPGTVLGDASVSMSRMEAPRQSPGDAFLARGGALGRDPRAEGLTMSHSGAGGPVQRGGSDVTMGRSAACLRTEDVVMTPAGEGPIHSPGYTGVVSARTDSHMSGTEIAEGGRGRTVSSESSARVRGR